MRLRIPTLYGLLRDEWGFEGIVMSDWFGTQRDGGIGERRAGFGDAGSGPMARKVCGAAQKGDVSKEAIDASVRRLLRVITWAGAFENPEIRPNRPFTIPLTVPWPGSRRPRALFCSRTRGTCCLWMARAQEIGLNRPNVKTAQIMGGGSAIVNAHYTITPFEAIQAKLPGSSRSAMKYRPHQSQSLARLGCAPCAAWEW